MSSWNIETYIPFVRLVERILFPYSFLTLFIFNSLSTATIIRVPQDHPTIMAGIVSATEEDTVLVDEGTYVENINFNGKNIVVASLFLTTGDPAYISQTVIDGGQSGSVVTFENGEDSTAVLSGFMITNGEGRFVAEGNWTGGGITCKNANPSLVKLMISSNSAWVGGGVHCSNSSPRLVNVLVSGNTATGGGGIFCEDNSSPSLVNVTVSGNMAQVGGGIFCEDNSSPILVNTIHWNNSAKKIDFSHNGTPNSITISYSNIQGGEEGIATNNNGTIYWLEGNIDANPLFCNPNGGDYALAENSPCVGTGENGANMGAFGVSCEPMVYLRYFRVISDDSELIFNWTYDEPGIDKFLLYYSTTYPADIFLDSIGEGTQIYVHTGLTNGIEYFYHMEAVFADGDTLLVGPAISGVPQIVSENVDWVGFWHERGFGRYADIWGYTDPKTGREYALLCIFREGLSIIDITGEIPVEVGFVPALNPWEGPNDVKVYDHYAIVTKGNAPAQVIDLSDPANPVTVSTIYIGSISSGGGAHNCYVDGDYLYTVGNNDEFGLIIYDLTDPTNPAYVGEYQPYGYYYHDLYVRNDTAYVAVINGKGVDILDVSDKTQPTLITNFNYPGSGAHNCWTTEDGDYLFVGDEYGTGNWTRVFDIRDLSNINHVADYIVDPNAIVHNSYVRGSHLFVAHYTEGIRIVDVSDPSQPMEVGYYDTYLPEEYGVEGCWSVYPYFRSGKLIASDRQSGLYVVKLDSAAVSVTTRKPELPTEFFLAQNYPNPFNPVTTLRYDLPVRSRVTLTIYDILGRQVRTLVRGVEEPGYKSVIWDGTNAVGEGVSAGVYLYRIQAGDFVQARKMILLR